MSWSSLIEAGQLVLIVLFALSSAEKFRRVASGSAAWHPLVIESAWRRRHARMLFGVACGLDIAAVASIAMVPRIGGPFAAALLVTYTVLSGGHISREGCRCFLAILDARSFTVVVARNSLLLSASAGVAMTAPSPTPGALPAASALVGLLWAGSRLADRHLSGAVVTTTGRSLRSAARSPRRESLWSTK